MRGRSSSFLGFIMTAVVAVPSAAFVMQRTVLDNEPEHRMELTSASGNVSIANSLEGQAILTAAPMIPGSQTTGTIELANTGDSDERLVLDAGAPVDQPGPGGGRLSERLTLRVEDVSGSGPPQVVYSGALTGLNLKALGTLDEDARRIYRFVVTFPDGGANGADNAYQGSSASIGFSWSVTASGPAEPPAEASLPEQVVADAPLAYWPLDGSQSTMADLVGGHSGEFANSVTTAEGPAPGGDSAAWFDGQSGYGYVNGIAAPTQGYTMEAWVRPASTRDMIIMEHGTAGTVAVRSGRFVFRHAGTTIGSDVAAVINRWQQVVGTWDADSGGAELYVDGELVASGTATGRPSGSATLFAGRGNWDGVGSFHGAMAQVSYFPSSLDAGRVGAHWIAGRVTEAAPTNPPEPSTPSGPAPSTPSEPTPPADGGTPAVPAPTCPGSVTAQGGSTSMWSILKSRANAAAKARAKQAKQAKQRKSSKSRGAKARGAKARAQAAQRKKQNAAKRAACARATEKRSSGG